MSMKFKRKVNGDNTFSLCFQVNKVPHEIVLVPPEFTVSAAIRRTKVLDNVWEVISIEDVPADEQISIFREIRLLKEQYKQLLENG